MRSLRLILTLLTTIPLVACSSKGGDGEDGTGTDGGPQLGAAVAGLAITKVSINQGVEIALHDSGADLVDLNAGLVQGRRALVRVYVQVLDGWEPREVQAVLTLEGDQGVSTYESFVTVSADSTEANLASTFSFELPGDAIPSEESISVSLHELDDAVFDGDSSQSAWPSEGQPAYEAPFESVGPLRIALVPVEYNADGSGRLPDISEAQIQRYVDVMHGMFPVPTVEITVTDPLPWGGVIGAQGQGWGELLNAMMSHRSSLGLGPDEYIYGIMAPADTFQGYCNLGCVAGLSVLATSPGDAMGRSSIGIGYAGEEAALTMAHEVGHAHGREHAPCGLLGQPSDPAYPYAGAVLGVWGWDGALLKDPNANTDIMAYCMPSWVSDYTYDALLDRSIAVNAATMGDELPPLADWTSVWVDEGGPVASTLTTRALRQPAADASSRLRSLRFLDGEGGVVLEGQARYYPADHLPGGFLLWPRAPALARAVDIDGVGRLAL